MGKVIFIGGDFSADAIGESYDLININLKDGHKTAIYRTQNDGSSYNLYSTGYAGWAKTDSFAVGSFTKIRGNFSWYRTTSLKLPPIVFLDASDNIVSAILPSTYSSGASGACSVSEIDVSIPSGATKVVFQCFTGDTSGNRYYTNVYAYLYK